MSTTWRLGAASDSTLHALLVQLFPAPSNQALTVYRFQIAVLWWESCSPLMQNPHEARMELWYYWRPIKPEVS